MAVAQSASGGVALRYVHPILCMTSHLAVMGATPKGGGGPVQRHAMNGVAIPEQSLMSMNACLNFCLQRKSWTRVCVMKERGRSITVKLVTVHY